MIGTVAKWFARRAFRNAEQRVAELEERVLVMLADTWRRSPVAQAIASQRVTRLIVSGSKFWVFDGTEADLEHQVAQIASITRSCVSVAAFVSHSHRKGCTACPEGGVVREGN